MRKTEKSPDDKNRNLWYALVLLAGAAYFTVSYLWKSENIAEAAGTGTGLAVAVLLLYKRKKK